MALSFGIIVGNRGFFPDHLAKSGREEMIAAVEGAGYEPSASLREQTKYGAVEIARRRQAVRGPVPPEPRQDRRHHRDAAELRRRARASSKRSAWRT